MDKGDLLKITLVIVGLISLSSLLLVYSTNDDPAETSLSVKGDIIIPIKSSRPGCEEDDQCYIPSKLVIKEGEQVIWINEDSAFHSVTSGSYDVPIDLFDSEFLDPFQSYTLTFDEVGTYDYFCTLHPWMEGQITVTR